MQRRGKYLTKEKIEEMKELYLLGYGNSRLGRMYNKVPSTIWHHTKLIDRKLIKNTNLKKEIKLKPKQKKYLRKLPPKTKMYKDYVREDADREFKKKMINSNL